MKEHLLPPLPPHGSPRLLSHCRRLLGRAAHGLRFLALALASLVMSGAVNAAVLFREDFNTPDVASGSFQAVTPTDWTVGTMTGTNTFYLADHSGAFTMGNVNNYEQLLLIQNTGASAQSNLTSKSFSAGAGTLTITGSIATRNGSATYDGSGGFSIYFNGVRAYSDDLGDSHGFASFSFTVNNVTGGNANNLTLRWNTTNFYSGISDSTLGIDWLQVDGNAFVPGGDGYWSGGTNASWGAAANWKTGVDNNVTGTVPTATDTVFFSTTTPVPGNLSTVLDAAYAVAGITFLDTNTSTVTIGNGGTAANTLTIGSGGITVQTGSAAPTISANVILGASQTWTLENNTGLHVSGGISGTGVDLTKDGPGTLTLSGTNSYGGTTISAGTLQVGNGGSSGSLGSGAVMNNGTLIFNRGDSATVANNISGSGAVIKNAANTLTLSGTLSHTGATTVNAGTLEVSGGADITQSTGIVVGGTGILKVDGAGSTAATGGAGGSTAFDVGLSGNLVVGETGQGRANVVNGGSLQSSNYTFISYNAGAQGTVTVNGAGSSLSSALDIRVGSFGTGTLNVQNGATVTGQAYDSIAFGTDSVGTATVTGTGSTWNTARFLSVGLGFNTVGNGGNGGNAQGTLNVFDGGLVATAQDARIGAIGGSTGTVVVDGANSKWTVGGNVDIGGLLGSPDYYGTGTINVNNQGAVIITGVATLGVSVGSTGTLNIGDGGSAGIFTAVEIKGGAGTATVNFEHSNTSYDFTSSITGTTTVNHKQGATSLTGASTYTGATNVTGGSLSVDGSLTGAGSISVAKAATFGGAGSATVSMNNSVEILGGLHIGKIGAVPVASTFTLGTSGTGSVTLGAESVVTMNLFTGAGLGDNTLTLGASDVLNLTGKLKITAGSVLQVGNPNAMTGFLLGDTWKVVDLNGGAGQIEGIFKVDASSLGLAQGVSVELDGMTGFLKIMDNQPQTSAQHSGLHTASAEPQAVMSGVQSMLGDINGRLFNLRAGWGEEGMGGAMDGEVIDGEGDGPEDPIAHKTTRSRQWEVYATVNYANISLSSIASQAGVDSQTWAPGVGIERHVSRHWAIGFAANLLETHQTYNNNFGSLDIEGVAASAYVSYVKGGFWGDLLYSLGHFDLESNRNPGFAFPMAQGDTTAWSNAVQFNTGWNFRFQNNSLVTGPFVGVDYLRVSVDGYTESGGGAAALAYAKRDTDSLITRVGWSVSKQFDTDFASITPQLRVSYERQNISNNNGTSVNLINQPFTASTNSESPGQDYLVAGAGVNLQFSPLFSMLVTYQGQFFREDMQAHYAGVRFSYKF